MLLELMERRIERPATDPKHVARLGAQSLRHGQAVQRLECESLEDERVERSLDEISKAGSLYR